MKYLFVGKQEKNVTTFLETFRHLIDRGHHLVVAVQERDSERDERLRRQIPSDRFSVVPCPSIRTDEWTRVAHLVRRLRDCVQYLKPAFRPADVLRARIFHKLRQELELDADGGQLAAAARTLPDAPRQRLESVLRLAEASLPTSPLFDRVIESHAPDVVLVSPLVHFGSAQADVAASARRLGIPVWMLLHSWDNLSTKGCMHVEPDLMFVWNEQQRAEAEALHGFPASRVVVSGAPRFDPFFELRPAMTREQFHVDLGLDPSRPTLLYLCSSRLIAPDEGSFIRRWLQAVGAASSTANANVIIRPHPDVELMPEVTLTRVRWSAGDLDAYAATPFDARTVVLKTPYYDPRGLYESLVHSTAVVGLNTTAELEAGIVGRPVFSIAAESMEAGQHETVHFHYLTRDRGGFVSVASTLDEHVEQLGRGLAEGVAPESMRAFIESFLRPHGIDRPVAPILADALERGVANEPSSVGPTPDRAVPLPPEEPAGVAPLACKGARIVVHVTPELARYARSGSIPVDRSTAEWIEQSVDVGDVLYDVNAGFGAYTLLAVLQRGATVVAFEPGYKAYGSLCENLALNGCQGSVIPLPLPLSNRDELAHLKYKRGRAGSGRYAMTSSPWRVRVLDAHVQSAAVTRLDTLVERHGLPAITHLRLSSDAPIAKVIKGATRTLAAPTLRTVFVDVPAQREDAVTQKLAAFGLGVAMRQSAAESIRIVFAREAAQAASAEAPLTRAAEKQR